MFRREQMEYLLNTANGIGPICIPTYKRWSREDNKALSFLELCQPDIRDNIHIFVRPEQAQAYHESFPWVHIVVLPAQIQGLASTREYICWYVLNVLHEPIFMDMDDDVTYLLYLWYDEIKQFSHYSRGLNNATLRRFDWDSIWHNTCSTKPPKLCWADLPENDSFTNPRTLNGWQVSIKEPLPDSVCL